MTERIINITKSYHRITADHDARINAWKDTINHYIDSEKYSSQIYNNVTLDPSLPKTRSPSTHIKVVEQDCIYAALEVLEGRTCILNMADWVKAGGAVAEGSRAQEEELFRRSNLHMHLHQNYYPMTLFQTVYSSNVEFIKNGFDKGYTLMAEPRTFDVISAPAICGPDTDEDGQRYVYEADIEIMRIKIRNLILIAAERQVNTLILSAWGCGAFGCPPTHTAQLFKEIMQEYDGLIPNIIFAIIGYNYEPFATVFNT